MTAFEFAQLQYNLNSFYLLFFGLLNAGLLCGLIFYLVGHVRTKNINSLLAQTIIGSLMVILLFLFFGQKFLYSTSLFDPQSVPVITNSGANYSPYAALFFHMLLPAISLCLVAGCVAERVKFSAFILFALISSVCVFEPLYCWVWGKGFLYKLGFVDVAGAGLIYLAAAIAGLTGTILIGPRKDKYVGGKTIALQASNIPLVMQGVLLFFIGSFGFNAGVHTLNAQVISMHALAGIMINTTCAGAAGLIAALMITRIFYGAIDLTLAANGLIAGLCAIAADPIHPSMMTAVVVGVIAALLALITISLLEKLRIDDPAGIIGSFGASSIGGLIASGLTLHSGVQQALVQNLGVLVIIVWVTVTSSIIWLLVRFMIGLRIKADDEIRGLDVLECGMTAYAEFAKSPE